MARPAAPQRDLDPEPPLQHYAEAPQGFNPVVFVRGAIKNAPWIVIAVVFHVRVQFAIVDVDLDASGRWVTLRGVHANFVHAVESRPLTERIANRA